MDTRTLPTEHDALLEGQRAGQLQVPAGANPHPMGTPESGEWERGRRSVEAQRLAGELRRRARLAPCRYAMGSCDCGGRGLCLDVA